MRQPVRKKVPDLLPEAAGKVRINGRKINLTQWNALNMPLAHEGHLGMTEQLFHGSGAELMGRLAAKSETELKQHLRLKLWDKLGRETDPDLIERRVAEGFQEVLLALTTIGLGVDLRVTGWPRLSEM